MKPIEKSIPDVARFADDQCTASLVSYHLTKRIYLLAEKISSNRVPCKELAYYEIRTLIADHIDQVKAMLNNLENFKAE